MPIPAALAVASLLAAAPPAVAPRGDVKIEGDVTYEPATGLLLVQNGAVIRRGDVVLRARSATYDPTTGEVRASGGVMLTDPTRFVAADGVRVILNGPFEAEGVVAFVKDKPTDLAEATTVDEARRDGRNRLVFSGARLKGDERGRFTLEGARLTLCDCPGGCAPSWELTTKRADVIPGVRATLSWPVLRVTPRFLFVDHPVPILVLPWLYLPLGERQSGLLLPLVDSPGATGFSIAEPVYFTLGRSYDTTITPWYAFGRKRSQVEQGDPAVRGPGARLELRWAPAEAAAGDVQLAYVHDLDAEPYGESGNRWALTGKHAQRIGAGTDLHATIRLFGDPVWLRDLTSDVLGRDWPYVRSDALLSHRQDDLVLEAGASYLEPLRPTGYLATDPFTGVPERRSDFGTLGAGLEVASRWPYAAATVVPVALGPLRLSGRAGFARFSAPSSAWDSGACWTATTEACPDPARRPAADRGDLRAEVSAPVVVGEVLSVVPYARGAATGYAFEASRDPTAAAWGVGGVAVATEVSRRFGDVRHAIAPRLEWRAGSGTAGDPITSRAYDAFDRPAQGLLSAAPPGTWQQLRASVETRLHADGADLLRLELGQDYDADLGKLAETFVGVGIAWKRLAASGSARFFAYGDRPYAATPRIPSPVLDKFTELSAEASISDARGDRLRAGFLSVGAGGSGTFLAGLDPLFDLRPAATDATSAASVGARVVASGATLGYDVVFPAAAGRAAYVPACSGGGLERRVSAWQTQQHTVTAIWDSPCRCFRVAASLRVDDCGNVGYSATLDLSRLAASR